MDLNNYVQVMFIEKFTRPYTNWTISDLKPPQVISEEDFVNHPRDLFFNEFDILAPVYYYGFNIGLFQWELRYALKS